MPAACSGELSTLAPTIGGCPADTELLLFVNVAGQQGGYAFRTWGTVKTCLLTGLRVGFLQFTVGQPGSPMNVGDNILIINQNNIIQDSASVVLGGSELPRNDINAISYGTPVYSATQLIITFDQQVQNGQQYIVHYAYTS